MTLPSRSIASSVSDTNQATPVGNLNGGHRGIANLRVSVRSAIFQMRIVRSRDAVATHVPVGQIRKLVIGECVLLEQKKHPPSLPAEGGPLQTLFDTRARDHIIGGASDGTYGETASQSIISIALFGGVKGD